MNWKNNLRFKTIGVVLVLALMMIPVSYVAAKEKDCDCDWDCGGHGYSIVDPIKTDAGYVSGTMIDVFHRCWIYYFDATSGKLTCAPNLMGEVGRSVRVYRGIPYAAPPIGDLRWKPPQPVTPWEGIRECTKFSPMAAQYPFPSSFFYGKIPESDMSEDCLYLNVITPTKRTNERLPVMVWFHGGGLTSGTNSPASVGNYVGPAGVWNGPPLPNYGLVLVTVQHRLGPIGYMAHPALTAESPHHASGNYGQLDLIAALKWVKKNIAAFGGDPHRIMIIGQSGGGSKVNGLVASPLAKGLFHRAVCQSGFSTGGTLLADAEQQGLNLAAKLGVMDSGPDGLAALRAKTWQDIVTAANTPPLNYSTNHTVDGWYLTDTIGNIFTSGRQNDVPYMMSYAGGEIGATNPARGQILLAMSQNQRSKIYVDVFTQVPDGWKGLVNAWHGSDVSYEFGDIGIGLGLFLGALLPTSLPLDPGVTDEDYWVADFMMSMLANFAATGNPSVKDMGVRWPAFEDRKQYYLDIGFRPLVEPGFADLATPQPPR
jgi:para-nitrobenzyl esterase